MVQHVTKIGVLLAIICSLFIAVTFSGCTVSDFAECKTDDDCAGGERCVAGGGVFVRDGVCVADGLDADVGIDAGPDADTGPQCSEDEEICDGQCVDTSTDADHCGGCGQECPAPENAVPICSDSECGFECAADFDFCSGACVDLQIDSNHCGVCGNGCPEGEICQGGSCEELECDGEELVCGSECVDVNIDPDHCGDCGIVCTTEIDGAQPICEDGNCADQCIDEEETLCPADGVCADLSTDRNHCGSCGQACGANEICEEEQCVCAEGYELCDGVCVNTQTNHDYCGDCETSCGDVEVCSSGVCSDSCPSGEEACSGGCHDLDTSLEHCQSCDNTCADDVDGAAPICTDEGCDYECNDSGYSLCEAQGLCANLTNDDDHCGECGNQCTTAISGAAVSCIQSDCVEQCTDPNLTLCPDQGVCADLVGDPYNCGECGNECTTDVEGAYPACVIESCGEFCNDPNAELCSDEGVCAVLDSDPEHCGACGNGCGADESCVGGNCVDEVGCAPGSAPFGGGDGSAGDPWRICSPAQFNEIGNGNGHLSDHFIVMDDIDLTGIALNLIGDSSNRFEGVFDGGGHSISNMTINAATGNYIGLFAWIGSNGEVKELSLEDVDVTGSERTGAVAGRNFGLISSVTVSGDVESNNWRVGGVVGENNGVLEEVAFVSGSVESTASMVGGVAGRSSGTIINSYSESALVTGDERIGGLVGHNVDEIKDSWSSATVSGNNALGGLVGYDAGGAVTESHATGDVSGSNAVGGLIGVSEGTIALSWASGNATATDLFAAGLVADNHGTVTECYATGSSTALVVAAGLVGSNEGTIERSYSTGSATATDQTAGGVAVQNTGQITDSYSSSDVESTFIVGGLTGLNGGSITNSHAYGDVNSIDGAGEGGLVGGHITDTNPVANSSFWDSDTTGQSTSAGGSPLTTPQFGTQGNFSGWDFTSVWEMGTADGGATRPVLQWQ